MNKNGLTLVEMIAVLVILSVVAVIVTPNIYVSIRDYKEQLYQTQMDNIKEAGKNWSTDNISNIYFPTSNTTSLKVSVQELQTGGYIEDKLTNPKAGGYFDDGEVFVLVDCQYIEDETNNLTPNYKYFYNVYEDISDYERARAIKYVKKNGNKTTTVTVDKLQQEGYIAQKILNTKGENITIPKKSIEVVVTVTENPKTGKDEYTYEAKIK